jgi:HEAT repeat protein
MWRRHADIPYTLLVLGVFTLELVGLGALIWTFALRLGQVVPGTVLQQTLIGTIGITGLGLLFLTAYILAYHVLSLPRERRRQERLEAWTEHWYNVLFSNTMSSAKGLDREAEEAALEVRERLRGDEGKEFSRLLEDLQVGQRLIARLGSRRLTSRLEALDALAKARLPSALGPLLNFMVDESPVVRLLSASAAARTMAELEPGAHRQQIARRFVEALKAASLPAGACSEIIRLLGEGSSEVLTFILWSPIASSAVLRAALDAVGSSGLTRFTDAAVFRITDHDREVRAAALRALGRLGSVPEEAQTPIVIALNDDTEFVRIQAARAAACLPSEIALAMLGQALSDRSWWVRRAAAESLLRLRPEGVDVLWAAARKHPDRFAGDMAAQVLLDSGISETTLSAALTETA